MKTPDLHINQLLKRCQKNDSSAQMEIYKLYYKAMYNSAFRILRDEFEAEDLMQEAFLTAFTKLNSFKGEVTFGAWLKRIVINKSLTQLKKNNRYQEVKLEVIPNQPEENDNLNYDNLNIKHVLSAIQKLKDNYRVILTLNLIEGYDNEEIMQILNYSNENVRTTISRAKKKLKEVLSKDINRINVV
ncbi:RNA polymerase sigma factor [uncultured Tenacibaculum sp.]|uniref:RNA polymerase sigma factor n=1 Tax=uncultured Tenacibaculum sp. TaxID=174713 RepID=UPI00260B5C33|nr:sigma-70 family RNA polymerase sigma factor [uncultured Tenacibaculum sp.]